MRNTYAARPAVLGECDIHIWKINMATFRCHTDVLFRTLSPDERARADRYVFPERRAVFIVVRAILRRVLAAYLDCHPAAIRFAYGPYGKPTLVDHDALGFNVSHSGDKAVIAVSRGREVGIDIEKVGVDLSFMAIAGTMFSPSECSSLQEIRDERVQAARFFTFWTRREAFLKAQGTGLAAYDIKSLDFDQERRFAPTDSARESRALSVKGPRPAQISLQDVVSFPGYASAVAVEGRTAPHCIFSYTLSDLAATRLGRLAWAPVWSSSRARAVRALRWRGGRG